MGDSADELLDLALGLVKLVLLFCFIVSIVL
jgi:hypothetical protein